MSEQNNKILLMLLAGSPEEAKDRLFQPPVPPTALVQTGSLELLDNPAPGSDKGAGGSLSAALSGGGFFSKS